MDASNTLILCRKDAAQYLGGICLTTLNRINIPKLRVRRRVFYRVEDLKAWIAAHTVPNKAEK
jgi:hypothetical protein